MSTRQLPQAVEAEIALLGSMILYPEAIETAVEQGLNQGDFYSLSNRKVYRAIISLYEEKKPVLLETLKTRLEDLGDLAQVGGNEYILQLLDEAGSGANARHYIQLIQEKARIRDLISVAESIKSESFDTQYAMNEMMDKAERDLLKVTRARKSTTFIPAKEVVDETVESIQKMASNRTPVTGMKTDFRQLDRVTNGFQKGDLIILAARPSMGKTAFALNIAQNVALQGKKSVAIFSLEMPKQQLVKRMLCAEAEVDTQRITSGNMQPKDWEKLVDAMTRLSDAKIYIDDTSGITATDIKAKCRRLMMEEKELGLVVIDYLQLMEGGGNPDDRNQQISAISRSLKGLARELNIPIIALSQLSRGVESRNDKRPMLSDLRDSGAIEQDADIVMFIYRDEYYNKDEVENKGKAEIIIAKHRNGPTGTVELLFQSNITKFKNKTKTTEF